jgi:anti-anti-sigma factor
MVHSQNLLALTAEWHGPIGVLAVSGALDANSATAFTCRVRERMMLSRKLIVDLRGLLFCAVAGFHALCDIDMEREELGAEWVVVPNAPVERLLQLCDPNHGLPLAPSLEQAWKLFHNDKWRA